MKMYEEKSRTKEEQRRRMLNEVAEKPGKWFWSSNRVS